MFDSLEPDELEGMPLGQAFRVLFNAHEGAPTWLYHPARSLARAEAAERDVEERVADLAEMSQEIDSIFRDYLPWLFGVRSQPHAPQATWPVVLARWIELLNRRATELLEREILPGLAAKGFRVLPVTQAAEQYGAWMHAHFRQHIYPLLTPLAVDPGRPFPFISSDSLNLLIELHDGDRHESAALMARLKVPSITPRLIKLPDTTGSPSASSGSVSHPATLIWSIDLVRHYIAELFVSVPIRRVFCFRVLRAPDMLGRNPEEPGTVRGRQARGSVVRVDVEAAMPLRIFDWLVDHLHVISYAVVRYESPAAVMSLSQLADGVYLWSHSGRCDAG